MRSVLYLNIGLIFFSLISCKSTDISTNRSKHVIAKSSKKKYQIKYEANIISLDKTITGNIVISNNNVFINGILPNIGIEVFKFSKIKDTICFIDRINKRYYYGNVNSFSYAEKYKALIPYINNILLGQAFNKTSYYTDENLNKNTEENKIEITKSNDLISNIYYCFNAKCFNIKYLKYNKKKVPLKIVIDNSKKLEVEIDYFEIRKINNFNYDIKIPKSYISL